MKVSECGEYETVKYLTEMGADIDEGGKRVGRFVNKMGLFILVLGFKRDLKHIECFFLVFIPFFHNFSVCLPLLKLLHYGASTWNSCKIAWKFQYFTLESLEFEEIYGIPIYYKGIPSLCAVVTIIIG